VFEHLRRARRGVRGGGAGGRRPPPRGFGGNAPQIYFFGRLISGTTYFQDHMILGGFSAHGFLPMVFYFRLRN
jgi:hypothetical protein